MGEKPTRICKARQCSVKALWGSDYCGLHFEEECGEEVLAMWREAVSANKHDLDCANLCQANLEGVDLMGARLLRADLSCARLRKANLGGAQLDGANLEHSDLRGALMLYACMYEANLRQADLRRAELSGASLDGSILNGSDLRGADLREAMLSGADLQQANLTGAVASPIVLRDANLAGAVLDKADLIAADIRGANMSSTSLGRTELGACLYSESLRLPDSVQEAILQFSMLWAQGGRDRFQVLTHYIIIPVVLSLCAPILCVGFRIAGRMTPPAIVGLVPLNLLGVPLVFLFLHSRRYGFRGASHLEWLVAGTPRTGLRQQVDELVLRGRVPKLLTRIVSPTLWGLADTQGSLLGDHSLARYVRDQSHLEPMLEEARVDGRWWEQMWMFLWGITCGYGSNIWLWIAWSGLLSFIFGLMYWVGGRNLVEIAESHLPPDLLTSLYFSIVTFTTLGFGDVTPVTGLGKVVVTAEVILGYVMLGGLISILANKLARLA